ncbi:MAG: hypothetical protein ACTSRU_16920 [Candidatus Hodarchaeales archaeon]
MNSENITLSIDKEREERINSILDLMRVRKEPFLELVSDRTAAELIGEGRER